MSAHKENAGLNPRAHRPGHTPADIEGYRGRLYKRPRHQFALLPGCISQGFSRTFSGNQLEGLSIQVECCRAVENSIGVENQAAIAFPIQGQRE
jgi:hypothetical protein